MKILIFFCFLLPLCHAQVDRDWSFQAFCDFWGGSSSYKQRESYNSLTGDTCTITFRWATDNEISAMQYCEENVPYHVLEAIPGARTVCKAEATLICKADWVQFGNRCYKMTKERMTRDLAEEHCKKEQATVAFLHREIMAKWWSEYFSAVYQLWIDASEAISNDLIYDVKNGYLLLAIDGYPYNLPNVAIARVDKNEKAMVLCEYTPPMNQAESSYLLKRYGEIYHPTIFTSYGAFVRTASSLNRNQEDPHADNKYCKRVMAPFVSGGNAISAVPTREFLEEVKKGNKDNSNLIVRTSAFSQKAEKSKRMKSTCVNEPSSVFHIYSYEKAGSSKIPQSEWKDGEPNGVCDAAGWSAGLVLNRDGDAKLESMSDARYAPIYCQSITDTYAYGDCPQGFSVYERKQLGQRWCHMLVKEGKTFDDAEKHCQTMGAHLSGFSSADEYKFLAKLMENRASLNKYNSNEVILGARRREECVKFGNATGKGYEEDETSACARHRVFEWKFNVAPNPFIKDNFWNHDVEPNYLKKSETCLVMFSRNIASPAMPLLNDLRCDYDLAFFCGVEAPIVKV